MRVITRMYDIDGTTNVRVSEGVRRQDASIER
jgi:hypothetical protein